jgi:hypothetical protein
MIDVAPQAVTQTEAAAKASPARYYVLTALALGSFLVGFHLGPIFAIAQTVARPACARWRQQSSCCPQPASARASARWS